ncbi:unnamed protein product, partial [Sphenostylis stenocarpa]
MASCISHENDGVREFLAEVSSLGRLKQRNLVGLRGWCKKDVESFLLVYDYMEKGSLDKRVFDCDESKMLSYEDRIRIVKDVAFAVLYLHEGWEAKVVHRDIKINNVLLDKDMNGRLGDFGLARMHNHDWKEKVKKCGGLPLGSSLFSRVDKKEWEFIRDNEIWNLRQNEKGILSTLKLSYDQLPSYLKPCFASFTLFPVDTNTYGSGVTKVWEALGFLPPPKEYESMVTVDKQILHELCLPRCIEKLKHFRYLSLTGCENLEELPDSICKLQNLQTLNVNRCIKLQKLPKGIGNLIYLRHLTITTRQPDFPEKEIANLTSLEILHFLNCDNAETLFTGIQLPNLKNLFLIEYGNLKLVSFHAIRNVEVLRITKCCKLELWMGLNSQIPDFSCSFLFSTVDHFASVVGRICEHLTYLSLSHP